MAFNLIATNFHSLLESDKAIYYYKRGLLFANKTTSTSIKSGICNNLGILYIFEKKEYLKGIKYYKPNETKEICSAMETVHAEDFI